MDKDSRRKICAESLGRQRKLTYKESWPTRMFVLSKTKQTGFDRHGVWLDRRTELDKSTTELDAARTTVKIIGHAVEIVKVR